MRSVAFALQKGGVGKTSVAVTTAHLAAANHRVLLVDADPQGSASSWLLTESPPHELADVLKREVPLADAAVSVAGNLDLLPTIAIGGDLRTFAENALERDRYVFDDLRTEAERLGYDLAVIDTSPANGRLERCVLLGCDEVVPVLSPEYLAVDGLELFTEFLTEVRRGERTEIESPRLVLNLINGSYRRHAAYQQLVASLGAELVEVRQCARVPEAQLAHELVPATSKVIEPLRQLAGAVTEGLTWR